MEEQQPLFVEERVTGTLQDGRNSDSDSDSDSDSSLAKERKRRTVGRATHEVEKSRQMERELQQELQQYETQFQEFVQRKDHLLAMREQVEASIQEDPSSVSEEDLQFLETGFPALLERIDNSMQQQLELVNRIKHKLRVHQGHRIDAEQYLASKDCEEARKALAARPFLEDVEDSLLDADPEFGEPDRGLHTALATFHLKPIDSSSDEAAHSSGTHSEVDSDGPDPPSLPRVVSSSASPHSSTLPL